MTPAQNVPNCESVFEREATSPIPRLEEGRPGP